MFPVRYVSAVLRLPDVKMPRNRNRNGPSFAFAFGKIKPFFLVYFLSAMGVAKLSKGAPVRL